MSAASLQSYWQESVRKTTRALQLLPLCSCLLLPAGGERGIGGGRRQGCTQWHPSPYKGAQRGSGLKEPRKDLPASLAGEGLLQARGPCSCKSRSLSRPAPRPEPNSWRTTVEVSEHSRSPSRCPGNAEVSKSCSSSVDLVEPPWRKRLRMYWENVGKDTESNLLS